MKQRIYNVKHQCGNEQILLLHDFSDKKHTNITLYLKQECHKCGELFCDTPPNYEIIGEIVKKKKDEKIN